MDIEIASAEDMEALGARFAGVYQPGLRVYLQGDLGAGKTTLVRGFLRGLGFHGKVKSPTYSLVEPYYLEGVTVYHFDFYRLQDPDELEAIGIRDYFNGEACCLVEWPEKTGELLEPADIGIQFSVKGAGRRLRLNAGTSRGKTILERLQIS